MTFFKTLFSCRRSDVSEGERPALQNGLAACDEALRVGGCLRLYWIFFATAEACETKKARPDRSGRAPCVTYWN